VFVARGLEPTVTSALRRLATNLASVIGLNLGSFNEGGNGLIFVVGIKTQTAELFFHL
jgi:hypothetical protein